MSTAAAIDRLVRHSMIVELNIPNYRLEQARNNIQALDEELPLPPGAAQAASGSGLRPRPPAASAKQEVNVVSS
jgi:hypothetical protein